MRLCTSGFSKVPSEEELVENAALEAVEIVFNPLADIVPEDQIASQVQPQPAADAAQSFPVGIIPCRSGVKEQRAAKREKAQSYKREANGQLVDERKPQFVTHQPEFFATDAPPVESRGGPSFRP